MEETQAAIQRWSLNPLTKVSQVYLPLRVVLLFPDLICWLCLCSTYFPQDVISLSLWWKALTFPIWQRCCIIFCRITGIQPKLDVWMIVTLLDCIFSEELFCVCVCVFLGVVVFVFHEVQVGIFVRLSSSLLMASGRNRLHRPHAAAPFPRQRGTKLFLFWAG